jgi:hypothetical protein
VSWSIYDVEGRRWQEGQDWVKDFKRTFGIEVEGFIEAYNISLKQRENRVSHNRAKYVSSDLLKRNIQLTPSQVDKIVARFAQHHRYYFDKLDK